MRISAEHSTIYHYPHPVQLEPHVFRLRPRMTTTQWLLAYQLQISPLPQGVTECLDQDGNLALHAWFNAPTDQLSVQSQFTVELVRGNPFDFLISGESGRLPLWYSDPLEVALAPYRRHGHVQDTVNQYANAIAANSQRNTLAFLTTLNQRLLESFRPITRHEGPPWTSEVTLDRKEGSCRDLAVLFCDCCRVVGIAARFVSGYECASAGLSDAYMHAWAEVYLPSAGWRGYDPARGILVADTHVAVASAFDHVLASPVTGSYYGGTAWQMEASLRMKIVDNDTPRR